MIDQMKGDISEMMELERKVSFICREKTIIQHYFQKRRLECIFQRGLLITRKNEQNDQFGAIC